jgi:hypothetical protein
MTHRPTYRQLLVSILALWRDRGHKEIGAAAGIPQKQVSYYLRREEIPDAVLEKLLAALDGSPAAVDIVMGCLEALEALEQETDLTAAERAEVENAVLRAGRLVREGLIEAARHSRRTLPAAGEDLDPHAIAYDRRQAAELFERLEGLPREAVRRGSES